MQRTAKKVCFSSWFQDDEILDLVVRIIDNNSFLTPKKQIISGKYKKIYPKAIMK
jgi:hypothetical protein